MTDAVARGLAAQVDEAMEDGGGFWRSCTGCHETNEGHSTGAYPYSAALKCELGAGCSECRGLGALWDNTDYADMAEFILAADRDHENVKRVLIENGIQPYTAGQLAMEITDLNIPTTVRGWVATLYCSAGCRCCRDAENWQKASDRLGELLGVPRYDDDSGVDWHAARDAAKAE